MSTHSHPIISIITVVYNGAKTLRATMDSIVPHLGDDVEYIVIDGGSTDGTQDIIAEYADRLAYWVSERDGGIYDAWNKGLAQASGRYIRFVGADDVLLPDALRTYLRHVREQPEIEYWSSKAHFGHITGRVIGKAWRWSQFRRYMTVAHVGSLHRRDLLERLGPYDRSYQIVGDYELLLRAGASLKAGFIDEVTVIMGDVGVSTAKSSCALCETKRAKIMTRSTARITAELDLIVAKVKYKIKQNLPTAKNQRFGK